MPFGGKKLTFLEPLEHASHQEGWEIWIKFEIYLLHRKGWMVTWLCLSRKSPIL